VFEFVTFLLPEDSNNVEKFKNPNLKILVIFIMWLFLRGKMHNILGTSMANNFHGGLFLFFLAGIWIQLNKKWFETKLIGYMSLITFMILSPLWSRVEEFNSITNAPRLLKNYYIGAGFSVMTALSGSIAILILSNKFLDRVPQRVLAILIVLGTNTLGIYVLHAYFIASRPPVLIPILASLLITLLIERMPILRTIFLGKIG
jgi:surface polysaccharide O-acyltransferase-like enzyme